MFGNLFGSRDKKEKKANDEHGVREDGKVRLPPGQYLTTGWPVLHYGGIPRITLPAWEMRVWGEVEAEKIYSWHPPPQAPWVQSSGLLGLEALTFEALDEA